MSPELLRYADLAESVPAVIYTAATDAAGTTLYVNSHITPILGYTPEEWLRDPQLWYGRVHPDDRDRAAREYRALSLGDPPRAYEYRMRRRDGRVIWVRDYVRVVQPPFGGQPVYHGVVIDITTEREALDSLRATEARYRMAFDASPLPMWIYDLETLRFLAVNDAAMAHYGYDRDEFLAMTIKDIWPVEDVPLLLTNVAARSTGLDRAGLWRHVKKDGTVIDVRITSHTMTYGGRPCEVVLAQDVTEQKRAAEQEKLYVARIERTIMGTANAIAGMVELRDPYTAGHHTRVGEYAAAIAAEMGLDEEMQRALQVCGSLHDVGKIATPADLLNKSSRLSPLEFDLIKGHAQAGYDVLKKIDFLWPVAEVARQHHERIDGSGYPRGLKGDAIIPEARIIAVADVIEAMGTHRPFRPALTPDEVIREIEGGRGTRYDAAVTDAALRWYRRITAKESSAKP